jgi:tetratricopeptide (TPR) repeat protein
MKNKQFYNLFIVLSILQTSCKKNQNLNLAKSYYEQSMLEAEEQRFQEAMQLVNKSLEITSLPQALALKASLFYQNKEYKESLAIFKQILKEKNIPSTLKADITNNIACINLALGNLSTAKNIWLGLTVNPNYVSPEVAWFNLGMLEFSQGCMNKDLIQSRQQIKNSQIYFSKAISIANEYVDAYFYLATSYMQLKDYKSAKDILVNLLSITPDHEPAHKLMEEINRRVLEQANAH